MMLHLDRFVGKVAVVTGASAGIGEAIAEDLVKRGIIVAGLARRVARVKAKAEELADEPGKLYGYKCDMTVEKEIVTTFKKVIRDLGNVHILVNNAGVMLDTDLIGGDTAKWKVALDTNILGLCIATREAIENMKAHNIRGHIIHINSTVGHEIVDLPGLNVYGGTKFAVTGLTETLIKELARQKLPIKVSSISPGYTATELADVAGLPDYMIPSPALNSRDISEAVLYVLSTPPSVNVTEVTVRPLAE